MIAATELFSAHGEAVSREVPVAEVLGEREHAARERDVHVMSRRELLAGATGLATAAAIGASPALSFASSLTRKPVPRIAIVGSGLAGLRCAHVLWNAKRAQPIAATVFEANPDASVAAAGRCATTSEAV